MYFGVQIEVVTTGSADRLAVQQIHIRWVSVLCPIFLDIIILYKITIFYYQPIVIQRSCTPYRGEKGAKRPKVFVAR